MAFECSPIGPEGLDLIVGGGFKKGRLIVVAGNTGTGKTVFFQLDGYIMEPPRWMKLASM